MRLIIAKSNFNLHHWIKKLWKTLWEIKSRNNRNLWDKWGILHQATPDPNPSQGKYSGAKETNLIWFYSHRGFKVSWTSNFKLGHVSFILFFFLFFALLACRCKYLFTSLPNSKHISVKSRSQNRVMFQSVSDLLRIYILYIKCNESVLWIFFQNFLFSLHLSLSLSLNFLSNFLASHWVLSVWTPLL